MKRFLIGSLFAFAGACAQADDALWNSFVNPPDDTRTKVWWFHGETPTTREGIDADLREFKAKGVGGVVYYDQVHSKAPGALPSMSPDWWEMLKYAAQRAKAEGLTFEVAASNGYVAGGPWITPDLGMQMTAWTDTVVSVGQDGRVDIVFPQTHKWYRDIALVAFPEPEDAETFAMLPVRRWVENNDTAVIVTDCGNPVDVRAVSYFVSPRGKGSTGSMNIPGKPAERYFGGKYFELPPIGHLEYSLDGKTWHKATELRGVESVIGHKSKERTVSFPAVRGRYFRVRIHDWREPDPKLNKLYIENIRLSTRDLNENWQVKSGLRTEVVYPKQTGGEHGAVAKGDIIDLSEALDSAGHLSAGLPEGRWHIIRMGYQPTGARTKHGRTNLHGPEADVMSAKAAETHYRHYFKAILDTLAKVDARPAGMCMDSHEAGIQNWTPGFENRFKASAGYDITPWIPALAGYIVGSRGETDAMLLDFRRAIARTIASEFYGTLGRLCREDGVDFTSQAMLNIDNDNILSRSAATKPQGEFWAYQTDGNYDVLDAASTAHLYGHPIASGEAFTDTPYETAWDELMRIANLAYCRGINEFAVCASSYQPDLKVKYDDDASAHPYIFHRLNPAWESVKPFWDAQARSAMMMRLGRPVVDLLVYIGEEYPIKTMAYRLPEMPEGYNFDVCNPDALLNRLSASDGRVKAEGGMEYKAILVQDRCHISAEALARLEQLERDGATVVWCNRGEDAASRLKGAGILPDVSYEGDKIHFFHRSAPGREIYLVYNHSSEPYKGRLGLRDVTDGAVELWSQDGKHRRKAVLKSGAVALEMAPYECLFVVAEKE